MGSTRQFEERFDKFKDIITNTEFFNDVSDFDKERIIKMCRVIFHEPMDEAGLYDMSDILSSLMGFSGIKPSTRVWE